MGWLAILPVGQPAGAKIAVGLYEIPMIFDFSSFQVFEFARFEMLKRTVIDMRKRLDV